MQEITLKNSKIYIANNILNNVSHYAKELVKGKNIFIVTDENVFPLYFEKVKNDLEENGFTISCFVLKAGEPSKSIDNLAILYDECAKNHITRSDLIIALGGGVVGDITGFLASTYLRGVAMMQIPTTLLSQIDSSVGGKTAVNTKYGKNLAGTFYQPNRVLIDPTVLNSLTEDILKDGLSEAIKYALIKDKDLLKLFHNFKQNLFTIIEKCVTIKKDIVELDEFDEGVRQILNFGHTIGHTIEKAGDYTAYTHGQAVCIGMVCASEISCHLGFIIEDELLYIKNILAENGLLLKVKFKSHDCLKYMKNDKKCEGEIVNAILLSAIGECKIEKFNVHDFMDLASKTSIWS